MTHTLVTAPATSQRPAPNVLDIAGTVLATMIDLAALSVVAYFFPIVAGLLLVPALVSAVRSDGKGYDAYRIWVRAAVVGLVTVAVTFAAFAVLFVYALSQWGS